jgi:hypothetical protein
MSYAQPLPGVVVPGEQRRPVTVTSAAVLLAVMALAGLVYAVATFAVTPGIVEQFRDRAGAVDPVDVDNYVAVVWAGAGVAAVLAVILFALYAVLALGLRSGSAAARVGTWVVCGLGLAAGCLSAVAVTMQRGADTSDALLVDLGAAYPGGWIALNVALSVAQMIGYAVVALLLLLSPREWFHRGAAAATAPVQPGYPGHPAYSAYPQTSPYQHQQYPAPTPAPAPGPDDEYWSRPG